MDQISPRGWGLEAIMQSREKVRPWVVITTEYAFSLDPGGSGTALTKDREGLGVGKREKKQPC